MARCMFCQHNDPHAAEFTDNRCQKCGMPQNRCPRCSEPEVDGLVCEHCRPVATDVSKYAHYFDDLLAYMNHRDAHENLYYETIIKLAALDMKEG